MSQNKANLTAYLILGSVMATACAGVKAKETPVGAMTQEFAYQQFVLRYTSRGEGPSKRMELDNPAVLPDLGTQTAQECIANPQPSEVASSPALIPIVLGWLADKLTGAVKDFVDAKIKEYSLSINSQPVHSDFYEKSMWFKKAADDEAQYSCFALVLRKCPKETAVSGVCPKTVSPSVVAIGQFRRTTSYLQLRSIEVFAKGWEPPLDAGKSRSIALRLKLSSIWWDGTQGHSSDVFDAPLFSAKGYSPTGNLTIVGDSKPSNWATTPIYPLPSRSVGSDSPGFASVTASLAEAGEPPAGLTWLQGFLGDNKKDLSGALKDAIEKLVK